ncbi:MAG: HEAT repeat domain-containing protein [Pseudomonadota bacterium]|nr:HEAT repeat domain-containing protein [Pseudomonadota bacterium]
MGLLGGLRADRLLDKVLSSGKLESQESVQAIDRLKGLGAAAVPRLVGRLESAPRAESHTIVALLSKLADNRNLNAFYPALESSDPRVVNGVVSALKDARNIDSSRFLALFDNPDISKPALLGVLSAHSDGIPAEGLLRQASKLEHSDLVMLFRIIEGIGATSLAPHLVSRVNAKDPALRTQIAKSLARFNDPTVQSALRGMLSDESRAVRLAALESLNHMDAGLDVVQLCGMLSDQDLKIQEKVVDALVKLKDPRTVQYLIGPLRDESEYTRRAAVEVLNELADADSIKDLLVAIKDEDWWVRSRAADALGTIGGPRVVDAVVDLIRDDDEFIRRTAVEIINSTGDERTYDALFDALGDSDWWVRERAIDGLAALGNTKAVPVMVKLLDKELSDEKMVGVIVRALTTLGSTQAIKPLLRLLGSESDSVRREVLEALAVLTDEPHAPLVIQETEKALRNAPDGIRNQAAELSRKLTAMCSAGGVAPDDSGSLVAPRDSWSGLGTVSMKGSVIRETEALDDGGVDPARMEPGDLLADRYRFIRQVGKGAFGTVYLMEDQMVNEELILKFLNARVASDETIIKRFVHELRFARKITHPNVIRIYDLITFGDSPAISMEYFPSHTLGAEIRGGKTSDPVRTLMILRDVCEGMMCAHHASVIHRDLKPSNILIDDHDVVKIVDFGVAAASRDMDTRLTKTGLIIGTPTYMSPEQVLGKKLDARADIYCLGVMMYEMLTGEPPYSGEDSMSIMYQHVQGKAPPPQEKNPRVSAALGAIVLKAMAAKAEQRFQSMEELKQQVDEQLALAGSGSG